MIQWESMGFCKLNNEVSTTVCHVVVRTDTFLM